ncbi:MAG: hypothetical protein BMS9Abin07_2034 [Acidimicrobiia bacterium]|nr:MAG: hypothetical protein BMS9Abin07_2034 [Acidimicrobiia bacterium]
MAVITDRQAESPSPATDPGMGRVQRNGETRFFAGLLSIVVLLIFGTLAVIAVLPIVVPGYTSASITTGSMRPALRPGDVVIAVSQDLSDIEEGAIVVYEDPRSHDLVTHRLIEIRGDGSFITKGDMNGAPDPVPIPEGNLRGQAQWIVPFVGWPRLWLLDGQWLLLAVTVVTLATALWFSRYGLDADHDPWSEKRLRGTP